MDCASKIQPVDLRFKKTFTRYLIQGAEVCGE